MILNESGRIITGAIQLCSTAKLFSDLRWNSLQKRCDKYKLVTHVRLSSCIEALDALQCSFMYGQDLKEAVHVQFTPVISDNSNKRTLRLNQSTENADGGSCLKC